MGRFVWAGLAALGLVAAAFAQGASITEAKHQRQPISGPTPPPARPSPQAPSGSGEAQGPQVQEACTAALATPEPIDQLTGVVRGASRDGLTVQDPRGRVVKLRVTQATCALRTDGAPMQLSQLREGSQVRAAYVIDSRGVLTASVVRVTDLPEQPGTAARPQPAPVPGK
jgi:hypothetical protein